MELIWFETAQAKDVLMETSVDSQNISHRGFNRQRVNREKQRNLGSPYITAGIVVANVQAPRSVRRLRWYEDGGVSHSSGETSNDRGAKGWQIVIT